MRSTVSRFAAIVALTLCIAACGNDSKPAAQAEGAMKWLSTGGPCEDLERIKNDHESKENLGLVFCGNAGHTFTGELRCERDLIEVQCR